MNLTNIIATRDTKTIYRDGDKKIKLFRPGYLKSDVLNEALNQARIEEVDLNTPKLLEVTMINDQWAIVSEYIEGKTLHELMEENPDKMNEYIDYFVDLQIKIHSQKCPLLTKLRDKMFRKISLTDFDLNIKFELQTHLDGMPRHNKVCHGDFRPDNVIITPDGVPYIIDWSHVTQGNASADVARTYLITILTGKKEIAEYYINTFCAKTNTERKYVEKWLRIVAASQSVKGNAEEREFLERIVDVVEYK